MRSGEEEKKKEEEEKEKSANIKSNNPHLAGGEQISIKNSIQQHSNSTKQRRRAGLRMIGDKDGPTPNPKICPIRPSRTGRVWDGGKRRTLRSSA